MMEGKMFKYLIYAFTMSFICVLVNLLHERPFSGRTEDLGTSYVVKPPSALKFVYLALFLTGLFLFFFFFFLRMIGNPSATVGHLRAFLVIAGIGLAVMIFAANSRLCVSKDSMELHRLMMPPRTVLFSEIEKVEVGKKGQLTVYVGSSRFCTVDLLSDNYDRFFETLEQKGLINNRK